MTAFIEYEIKVAIALAVFTLFYKLLLQKDTFHRFNRVVLLVTSALAFALPFFVIVRHETIAVGSEVSGAAAVAGEFAAETAATGFSFMQFLEIAAAAAFFAGAVFMLLRIVYSIFKIRQLIASGRHLQQEDGTTIVVVKDNDFSPVSWMKYIVMSEEDYSSANEGILIHERAHIALGHSWDILFFDLMTVLQWFNPAIWLLKADLRAIHEYEADEAVITAGTDMREYQLLLVRKAVATVRYQAANSLTHSTLKNRIKMMSSKKSSLYGALKALYVLPLVAVSLIANAETKYDYVALEPEKVYAYTAEPSNPPLFIVDGKVVSSIADIASDRIESMEVIKVAEEVEKIKAELKVIGEFNGVVNITLKKEDEVVEFRPMNWPKFNDGDMKLFSAWANMQIMYPADARKEKAEGLVVAQFTIDEKGKVTDAKIVKSVHKSLDRAVLKTVTASSEWTPGKRDGKEDKFTLILPVHFDIRGYNDDKAPESTPKTAGNVFNILDDVYVTAY